MTSQNQLFNFPYFEVQFNKSAQISNPNEVQKLIEYLNNQSISDLLVMSHGWNSDIADARGLYHRFFKAMRQVLDQGVVAEVANRNFGIMAIFWPSKKFTEAQLIPGGAASFDDAGSDSLKEQLSDFKVLFDDSQSASTFEQLESLIPNLEDSPTARGKFADLVRSLLSQDATDDEDASSDFFSLEGEELMKRLNKPLSSDVMGQASQSEGGAAGIGDWSVGDVSGGGAAGLFGWFGGFKKAAGNLLNFATYYEMKQRAGNVGIKGLNPLLKKIQQQLPQLKLHLMGHSFGGRLVTATAMGPGQAPMLSLSTLTLMQAAFSHYGFARHFSGNKNGYFRPVIVNQGISGPIIITHSKHDKAVGIAYPIASSLAQDDASGIGDENDRFGGIGRNGAQKTPEAIKGLTLKSVGGNYAFEAGKAHNLRSDSVIKGHSDIVHPEVCYAILRAIAGS